MSYTKEEQLARTPGEKAKPCRVVGCIIKATTNSIYCRSHWEAINGLNKKSREAKTKKPPSDKSWDDYFKAAKKSFQRYIRAKEADYQGIAQCVSCGLRMVWDGKSICHAGHYFSAGLSKSVQIGRAHF